MRHLFHELRVAGRLTTASVVGFSHVYVAATTLFQSIALARFLTLREFGLLAASIAISSTVEAAINARGAETGLAAFSSSKASTDEERMALANRLIRLDFVWSSCAYFLFAIAILIYDQLTHNFSFLLFGLLVGGWAAFPWGTAKSFITVYLSPRMFARVELGYATVAFIVGPLLAYLMGIWGFVLGLVAASILRTGLGLWVIGFKPRNVLEVPQPTAEFDGKTIWWFGSTGTLRSFLINGLQQFDLILLAAFANPATVGLYRAAKTISNVPQRLGQPIWVLLKREIIKNPGGSGRGVRTDSLIMTSTILFILGLIISPFVIMFSSDIMSIFFGPRFAVANRILWWLIPSAWFLYGVTGWSSTFGSVSKRRLIVIAIYLAQLAAMMGVLMLTKVSGEGMAKAVAISQVVAAFAFWGLYVRREGAKT